MIIRIVSKAGKGRARSPLRARTVTKRRRNSESPAPTGVVALPIWQTGDQFTQEALDFLGIV